MVMIPLLVLSGLALVLCLVWFWRAAIPVLRLMVVLDPHNSNLRIWLGDAYVWVGRWEEAGRCLVAAYAIDPTNEELVPKLRHVFAVTGRPESALEELKAVVAARSGQPAAVRGARRRRRRPGTCSNGGERAGSSAGTLGRRLR